MDREERVIHLLGIHGGILRTLHNNSRIKQVSTSGMGVGMCLVYLGGGFRGDDIKERGRENGRKYVRKRKVQRYK